MNSVRKIIFLVESPFRQRDYVRFGFELLRQSGFELQAWDVSPWLHPEVCAYGAVKDPVRWNGHRILKTRQEATAAISGIGSDCFAISLIGYTFKSFPLYLALSRSRVHYGVFAAAAMPELGPGHSPIQYHFKRLQQFSPARVFNSLFVRIPFSLLGIRPARLVLALGARLIRNRLPISEASEILWLPTLDHDLFLHTRTQDLKTDAKAAVFLDEFRAFHPDYAAMGEAPPVSPDRYYASLRRFFDLIESRLGIRIIIAAHPRSDYESRNDVFGGREVIRGKTPELVAKTAFALTHSSTSLSFAVLFRRPILFLTTDELEKSYEGPLIDKMAEFLGKKTINIDTQGDIDWAREITVDSAAYDRYRDSFLKRPDLPEADSWALVAARLRSL